jgi:hypothetical protein
MQKLSWPGTLDPVAFWHTFIVVWPHAQCAVLSCSSPGRQAEIAHALQGRNPQMCWMPAEDGGPQSLGLPITLCCSSPASGSAAAHHWPLAFSTGADSFLGYCSKPCAPPSLAGRLTRKQRKRTLTEELLADPELARERKKRFAKLQQEAQRWSCRKHKRKTANERIKARARRPKH